MNEENKIQFLTGLSQKIHSLADHIDTQSSILLGVTSTVFVFSASQFYYRPKRALFNTARNILIIGIGCSLLAFVLAL